MNKKLLDYVNQKIEFWQPMNYDDYYGGYVDALLAVKKFIEEMEGGDEK